MCRPFALQGTSKIPAPVAGIAGGRLENMRSGFFLEPSIN